MSKDTFEYGTLEISDDVIATYINNAIINTDEVYDFSGGFSDALSKNILGKESKYKGIKITEDDEGYTIDLYLVINYGVRIPELAWSIQKNVTAELEEVMDITIKSVNVHIQGVHDKMTEREEYTNEQ